MLQLIVLVAVLVVLLHLFVSHRYDYWKKRGIPGPSPTFLLGNLGPSLMMKQNPGQIYQKIYNKFSDKSYVGYYKFLTPGLILRDIELIKDVLIKDFNSFHDNDFYVDAKIDRLFGRNPFTTRGQQWKQVRNLVTSGITSSKVKNMFYLISNACKNLVSYLEQQPNSVDGLEAKDLASKFTTDAVASCAFGLEAKCLENDGTESEFFKMGKKVIEPSFWMGLKHMVMLILPSFTKLFKIRFITKEAEDWFINVVKDTVQYRDANNINRHDYLDMLRSIQEKTGGFDTLDIAAQAFTFYADGFETSAITLSHTLYELGENTDIQTRLRNEIDIVLAKHNGEINYDSIQEMTYLDCVLNEGLRKHSPIHFIIRLCTKRFELPSQNGTGPNIIIEPGTPMVVPVLGIHNDPTYYPNPQKFDPERFNEENRNSRPKCTFLAFGEGPRICLGSKFGLAQTKAALVAIISHFEVTVNPKTRRPLQLDPQYFMTNTVGGIWLNFKKRS